ncbi:radical SAM protein [Candidatus Omnitrophota bacterium]
MVIKEANRLNVKQQIGRVYSELKWLSEKEAKQANKERDELLKSISHRATYSFKRNKIHSGRLSPGCLICGQGAWSCMFINGLCTANCFFCPQDRKIKKERSAFAEDIIFDDPDDYVSYLEKFNFKGVAFSGGEALLVFEKLLLYIRKIRERFGRRLYLWIYTNGDLIDKNKLRRLKEAGLNEIRFNISARDYDLRCLKLATGFIDRVTVEIPAIPEDYEKVRGCLKKMQELGVVHLNIHQLQAYKYNYRNFIDRKYTFLHQPDLGIFESEMTALKILKYAFDKKISLPINYCSREYKNRFHGKNGRKRIAFLVNEDFEELTQAGYIRRLSIQDSSANINHFLKILQNNKRQRHPWSLNNAKTEIFIHGPALKDIKSVIRNLSVSYFEPKIMTARNSDKIDKAIALNSKKRIFIKKKLRIKYGILNEAGIRSFEKLIIKNMNDQKVLNYFYRNYNLKTRKDLSQMKREINILLALKGWEGLEEGFSEIY